MLLDRPMQALPDCNEALRLRPGYGDALDGRGIIELKLKKAAAARADCDAALRSYTRDAQALYCRGLARHRLGDKQGGDADIAAAKTVNPAIAETFASYGLKG